MKTAEEKKEGAEDEEQEVYNKFGKIEPCNTRLNFNFIKHAILTIWRMVH